MRFIIDNSLSWRLAEWLRTEGHDALHVRDVGLRDATDATIYSRAITDSRIIVTQDVDFGALLANDHTSAGTVILFRLNDGRVDAQVVRLRDLLARFPQELIPGTIVVLTDAAIRIRRF